MPHTASRLSSPHVWHEANPRDGGKAGHFYSELLGWTTTDVNMGGMGTYTMFQQNGQNVGGIVRMTAPEYAGAVPQWAVYIHVENVDRCAAKAQELGGTVCIEPFDIPNVGRACIVLDPDGASFYLFTPKN